jgi:AraC-like DNA-binding protein
MLDHGVVSQRVEWSTGDVGVEDAVGYWGDVICDALVQVSARPIRSGVFEGRVRHVDLDDIGLSVVSSGAQTVDRTKRLIARADEDFLLANIQLEGHAQIRQDGRTAFLSQGAMTFVDSSRPYSMNFSAAFSQLIVRVPRWLVPRRSVTEATALVLNPAGPAGVVADFFIGLERLDPEAAAALVPHSIGLLDSALGWATRTQPSNRALTRERIYRFVRQHAADPDLDATTVATGCGISRRTLYRALANDSEPLTALIRRQRVTRAQQLLRSAPQFTVAQIARESGFGGTAQLQRAFQTVAGTTPGAYRAAGTDRH